MNLYILCRWINEVCLGDCFGPEIHYGHYIKVHYGKSVTCNAESIIGEKYESI